MTDSVKQPATLIRSQYRNASHYLPDFPEVEVCHFLLLQGPTHCSTAVSCSLPSTDRSIPGCVLQEADTACIMSMKSALRVATHRNERKEAGLGRGEMLHCDATFKKVSADPWGAVQLEWSFTHVPNWRKGIRHLTACDL